MSFNQDLRAFIYWNASTDPSVDHYMLYVGFCPGADGTVPGSPKNMGNNTDGFFDLPTYGVYCARMTTVNTSAVETPYGSVFMLITMPRGGPFPYMKVLRA